MISITYAASGLGLLAAGYAFLNDWLDATTLTLAWAGIFFVASAAASSAYLTVSEVFRSKCERSRFLSSMPSHSHRRLFHAGGVRRHHRQRSREALFLGYAAAGACMCAAAVVAFAAGIDAERKPLETVTNPLVPRDAGQD